MNSNRKRSLETRSQCQVWTAVRLGLRDPLVIRSPRTRVNARCERSLCMRFWICLYVCVSLSPFKWIHSTHFYSSFVKCIKALWWSHPCAPSISLGMWRRTLGPGELSCERSSRIWGFLSFHCLLDNLSALCFFVWMKTEFESYLISYSHWVISCILCPDRLLSVWIYTEHGQNTDESEGGCGSWTIEKHKV